MHTFMKILLYFRALLYIFDFTVLAFKRFNHKRIYRITIRISFLYLLIYYPSHLSAVRKCDIVFGKLFLKKRNFNPRHFIPQVYRENKQRVQPSKRFYLYNQLQTNYCFDTAMRARVILTNIRGICETILFIDSRRMKTAK